MMKTFRVNLSRNIRADSQELCFLNHDELVLSALVLLVTW